MHRDALCCLIAAAVICSALQTAEAKIATSLTVHRVLHAEREGSGTFGPQATTARGTVAIINTLEPYLSGSATSKVAILVSTASPDTPAEAAGNIPANVMSVLSDGPKGVIFTEDVLDTVAVQSFLLSRSFLFPLVLAPNSQNLTSLIQNIIPDVASNYTMGLVFASLGSVKLDAPTKLELPDLQVLQASITPPGYFKTSKKTGKAAPVTTTTTSSKFSGKSVLLSAAVDGLGITPSHEYIDVSGAAVVAEIYKTIAHYNETTDSNPFALHSIMASHARWNYVGTRRWMSQYMETHAGQSLSELFDFSVSLDTVMPAPMPGSCGVSQLTLYVHSAAPIELDPAAERGLGKFCALLLAAGKDANVEIQFVSRKINVTHHDLRFEHEVFAHKKLPAITISTYSEPQSQNQLLRHTYCRRLPNSPLTDRGAFGASSVLHAALSKYFGIAEARSATNKLSLVGLQGLLHSGVHRDGAVDSITSPHIGFRSVLEKYLKRNPNLPIKTVAQVVIQKFPSTGLPVSISGPLVQTVEFHIGKTSAAEILVTIAVGMFVVTFAVLRFGTEKTMMMFASAPAASKQR